MVLRDRRATYPRSGRPYGIWFGPLIWHNDRRLNIDIWFVTQDESHAHHNSDIQNRMLNITEEQRKTILEIKYQALVNGQKEKGVTSTKVYIAVLDKNITTYEEFINSLN